MPSKTAHLIAFIAVFSISASLHRFVYANFKRVLLRDFQRPGPAMVRAARALFIIMDVPFIFLYFRNQIHYDLSTLNRILIYPFSIWQAIMIMWVVILVPFTVWRRREQMGIAWIRERIATFRRNDDPATNEIPTIEDGFDGQTLEIAPE